MAAHRIPWEKQVLGSAAQRGKRGQSMKPNFDVLHPALTCGQQFSSQQCSVSAAGVSVTLLSTVVLGGFPPNLVSSFPRRCDREAAPAPVV